METLLLSSPYCKRLREIPQTPKKLYVIGNSALLGLLSIAVVGTRRPSPYGVRASFTFGRDLASHGFVVVSGLAKGIDTAAHQGAIAAGGMTVAVLGHGLDVIYPARNAGLAHEIVEKGGCLVSEYPPGTPPLPGHFPARNRLISGLALGTLVVEAARKSGSLITASHALDQGRDVFVIPGQWNDSNFDGGHCLIQQGAKLVREVSDILEEYPWLTSESKKKFEIPTSWNWLRKFKEPATLIELQELSGKSSIELGEEIEVGLANGYLLETAPQTYLWVGESEKESSFHPAPCQNSKI